MLYCTGNYDSAFTSNPRKRYHRVVKYNASLPYYSEEACICKHYRQPLSERKHHICDGEQSYSSSLLSCSRWAPPSSSSGPMPVPGQAASPYTASITPLSSRKGLTCKEASASCSSHSRARIPHHP